MGDDNFSVELCGGTHVEEIRAILVDLKLSLKVESLLAIRRIEAITGIDAYQL